MMYEQIAHYYDLTHTPFADDLPFLLRWAKKSPQPILELGCGTGRVALPLARNGYTVVGVDNSAAMLAVAQQHSQKEHPEVRQHLLWQQADMTQLKMPQQFGLILSSFNTLMHLTTPQLLATLKMARQHILPEGFLLIDVMNPAEVMDVEDSETFIEEQIFRDPAAKQEVRQSSRNWHNQEQQIFTVEWAFEGVKTKQRLTSRFDYHYLFPHQWQNYLQTAGWRLEKLYGDYDETPFEEESERLILVAVPEI